MTLLLLGSRGQAVFDLQRALRAAGATALIPDGLFGADTQQAVCALQQKSGLVVDGIVGPKTLSALKGGNTEKLLKQADLLNAAQRLDLPLACVMAVNYVESTGSGFLSNGAPVILFERHIMYRLVKASGISDAALAALVSRYPSVINETPGGYMGGTAEHQRFKLASHINADTAIEATAFGLFQIMGQHWPVLDYESAATFAARMASSETAQLEAFVRFINVNPALNDALKRKQWAKFARLYNGPDYAKNLYDVRLARACQHFEQVAS
jgi:hypothetical protein